MQIRDSQINPLDLATKFVEKRIINDAKKREITDAKHGLTYDERLDKLLDQLKVTVNVDGAVFGVFIEILKDFNTLITDHLASNLLQKYEESKGK